MANTVATLRTQVLTGLIDILQAIQNGFATAVAGTAELTAYQTVVREIRDLLALPVEGLVPPASPVLDAIALLAGGARTATTSSAEQVNAGRYGVLVVVAVTAYTAGGLTPSLNKKNEDGTFTALLTGTKITATGKYVYVLDVGAGVTAAGIDKVVAALLPQTWKFTLTVDDATSITYSVSAYPF